MRDANDPLRITWPMTRLCLAVWRDRYVQFSSQEYTILLGLAARRGRPLQWSEVDDMLWGARRDGGPEGLRQIHSVLLASIRRKMPGLPVHLWPWPDNLRRKSEGIMLLRPDHDAPDE